MTRKPLLHLLPALLLLPLITFHPGGWATITVENLPDYLVAGQSFDLTFTIRQHGRTPLNDLTPRVRATAGSRGTTVKGVRAAGAGQYVAALTVPEPGDWTINIHSGFQKSEVTLLPLTAIAGGARATTALSEAERGRRLFVAKGCISCHINGTVEAESEAPVGPELTGRRYPAEYLQRLLADPASVLARRETFGMPNFNLDPQEIAALVTFLNTEMGVSGK